MGMLNMKKLLLILLMILPVGAYAATMFVATNPSTFTDGRIIPSGGISRVSIYCGAQPGVYDPPYVTTNPARLVPGQEMALFIKDTPFRDGTFYCMKTTTATGGSESAPSAELGPIIIVGGVTASDTPSQSTGFGVR